MMTKKLFLFLAISLTFLQAQTISFKELTKLASADLGKNIYLDKDIPEYTVEFNIVDHQEKGEVYEFFKIVLFENDMELQYNSQGGFYFIKQTEKTPDAPPEIHESLQVHYYTYKIKNITNEDVADSMLIFPTVKYKYLKQSDLIAYSATEDEHEEIKQILASSDNAVTTNTIKITLFSINKKKFLDYGSSIRAFKYDMDSTLDGVFQAFRSNGSNQFSLNDSFNFGFTLHALQGHNIADIFQQPTLRLTNGIKSSVKSVVNVPYLKTTSTVDSTTNSVTQQYEYKDIGLQIDITPKIKDNWVYLNMALTSDELISLDNDKPITQKIFYENTFKVTKGKPILLTGIKKTSKQVLKDGIPILSDIPIIGELFKNQVTNNDEQNMNIMIEVL